MGKRAMNTNDCCVVFNFSCRTGFKVFSFGLHNFFIFVKSVLYFNLACWLFTGLHALEINSIGRSIFGFRFIVLQFFYVCLLYLIAYSFSHSLKDFFFIFYFFIMRKD